MAHSTFGTMRKVVVCETFIFPSRFIVKVIYLDQQWVIGQELSAFARNNKKCIFRCYRLLDLHGLTIQRPEWDHLLALHGITV